MATTFEAQAHVADLVNAALDAQAASVDAFYDFVRAHLPAEEVGTAELAQGLHALAERVASHTDACWRNFEVFASQVFARPAALDAEAAAEAAAAEAAASAAFSSREEAELDARAAAVRARLAAALAATAAMRGERAALSAELAAAAPARRSIAAAAASEKENAEAACELCVALSDGPLAPLLARAEQELCAQPRRLPPAAAEAEAAEADGARRRAALGGASLAALATLNARLA